MDIDYLALTRKSVFSRSQQNLNNKIVTKFSNVVEKCYEVSILQKKTKCNLPKASKGTRKQLSFSAFIMIGNTYNHNGIVPREKRVETVVITMLQI